MTLSDFVKNISRKPRHFISKLLAPKIWDLAMDKHLSSIPRPMIKYLQRIAGKKELIGAEIGVADGLNAESILKTLNVSKLFLIDPYEPYCEKDVLIDGHVNELVIAKKRLKPFQDKIQFIQLPSQNSIHLISDNLDFIYIDGNHSYEAVKEDIMLYFPKLKKGGVLGGHDFIGYYPGVVKAVMEFSFKNNKDVMSEKIDWWLIKT